ARDSNTPKKVAPNRFVGIVTLIKRPLSPVKTLRRRHGLANGKIRTSNFERRSERGFPLPFDVRRWMFLRVHGQGGPRRQPRVGAIEMRAAKRRKKALLDINSVAPGGAFGDGTFFPRLTPWVTVFRHSVADGW